MADDDVGRETEARGCCARAWPPPRRGAWRRRGRGCSRCTASVATLGFWYRHPPHAGDAVAVRLGDEDDLVAPDPAAGAGRSAGTGRESSGGRTDSARMVPSDADRGAACGGGRRAGSRPAGPAAGRHGQRAAPARRFGFGLAGDGRWPGRRGRDLGRGGGPRHRAAGRRSACRSRGRRVLGAGGSAAAAARGRMTIWNASTAARLSASQASPSLHRADLRAIDEGRRSSCIHASSRCRAAQPQPQAEHRQRHAAAAAELAALDPGRQPAAAEHRLVFDVVGRNAGGRRHGEALDPELAAALADPVAELAADVARPRKWASTSTTCGALPAPAPLRLRARRPPPARRCRAAAAPAVRARCPHRRPAPGRR